MLPGCVRQPQGLRCLTTWEPDAAVSRLTTILISRYLLALGKFGRRGEDSELYSTGRASIVDLDPTFISPDPVPGQRDGGDSTDFA